MLRRRRKLTVIYKSGAVVHAKASKFTVTGDAAGGFTYSWTHMTPRPLLLGADDVAAVYEGHV